MTMTLTHNKEEGGRDGWQGEGEATGKGVVGEGADPPPRTSGEDGGQRDQREGCKGIGGGPEGNLVLCESAPRSGACDWPRVAMVAWMASTEVQ